MTDFDREVETAIATGSRDFFPDPLSAQTCCAAGLFIPHLVGFLSTLNREADQEPLFTMWRGCLERTQQIIFVERSALSPTGKVQVQELLNDIAGMCRQHGEFFSVSGDQYQSRQFAWRVGGCMMFLDHLRSHGIG